MENGLYEKLKRHRNKIFILAAVILILDGFVWYEIAHARVTTHALNLYFLDVNQGDSELIALPGGATVMVDGGNPNGKALAGLASVMPFGERTIDVVIVSHPQLDHFGGLIDVLKRYRVGVFAYNGREGTASAFKDLMETVQARNVPVVKLMGGDEIRYGASRFEILSPDKQLLQSEELNDTTLVTKLTSSGVTALYTGDISANVEKNLVDSGIGPIDVLKVPHHGSKYSSSVEFLNVIQPKIAVIEVGKNSYGHPTLEALERLSASGAHVYRTDKDGMVHIIAEGEKLSLLKSR